MAVEMIPERCAEHKMTETEILARLKVLEDDVKELYSQIKDKVDTKTIDDIMNRSTREIEEIKRSIVKLGAADVKHGETLAGIQAILQGFKETQDLLRQDYSKLAECYTQTSVHIASITAILAERAKKQGGEAEAPAPKDESTKDPWYVKLINKSKALSTAIVILVTTIAVVIVTRWGDIVKLLTDIFGK